MVATKPLTQMLTADIMSRAVVAVPQDMLLQDAARLLAREQITGAPVVDAAGRCVGVLSATDFVHWAEKGNSAVYTHAESCYCADWQVVDLEAVPRDEVRRHMSTDLVRAEPETPLTDLARRMIDAHVHRVIVTDEGQRPVGIVSTTDILAAVAYAAAESES